MQETGTLAETVRSILDPPVSHSIIWPERVFDAVQGMVFKVLSLQPGYFHIRCLDQGGFLNWKPLKRVERMAMSSLQAGGKNNFYFLIFSFMMLV